MKPVIIPEEIFKKLSKKSQDDIEKVIHDYKHDYEHNDYAISGYLTSCLSPGINTLEKFTLHTPSKEVYNHSLGLLLSITNNFESLKLMLGYQEDSAAYRALKDSLKNIKDTVDS